MGTKTNTVRKVNGSNGQAAKGKLAAVRAVEQPVVETEPADKPGEAVRVAAAKSLGALLGREPTAKELDALAEKLDRSVYYAARAAGKWPPASPDWIAKSKKLHAALEAAVREGRIDPEMLNDTLLSHSPSPWARLGARGYCLLRHAGDTRAATYTLIEQIAAALDELSPRHAAARGMVFDPEDDDKLDAVREFLAGLAAVVGLLRWTLVESGVVYEEDT